MHHFQDLWELDDGGGGDDGDAEEFGDGEGKARVAGGEVEGEEKGGVAFFAEELVAEGDDGGGEGGGEGEEVGAESFHLSL